jgi:hypothetical protein
MSGSRLPRKSTIRTIRTSSSSFLHGTSTFFFRAHAFNRPLPSCMLTRITALLPARSGLRCSDCIFLSQADAFLAWRRRRSWSGKKAGSIVSYRLAGSLGLSTLPSEWEARLPVIAHNVLFIEIDSHTHRQGPKVFPPVHIFVMTSV